MKSFCRNFAFCIDSTPTCFITDSSDTYFSWRDPTRGFCINWALRLLSPSNRLGWQRAQNQDVQIGDMKFSVSSDVKFWSSPLNRQVWSWLLLWTTFTYYLTPNPNESKWNPWWNITTMTVNMFQFLFQAFWIQRITHRPHCYWNKI